MNKRCGGDEAQRKVQPAQPLSLPRPCLMLVTEPGECTRFVTTVQAAVAGGVNAVQLRDKTGTIQQLLETAAVLKASLPDILMLVNGWQGVDCFESFDGVHLPEHSGSLVQTRLAVGTHRLIGRSVHSLTSAVEAENQGADYLVAGTIFGSVSHPDVSPAGLEFLRRICTEVSLPVIAIGGITLENVAGCVQAGAAGVAVLSPLMRADDTYNLARQYRSALEQVWVK